MPITPEESLVRRRNFQAQYPGPYAYWFLADEGDGARPDGALSSRWQREAASLIVDDQESSDPAMFWQCLEHIPNCTFDITFNGNLDALPERSSNRVQMQIYTVMRGTHRGKRLVKARDIYSHIYKAVGFLNRDRTFTPWSSSPWSEDEVLHNAIRSVLLRHDFLGRQSGTLYDVLDTPGITVRVESVENTCHICNGVTLRPQMFCGMHAAPSTMTLNGTECPLPPPPETPAQQRRRLLQERDAAERANRARQAREREDEERRLRDERIRNFQPALSEIGTGLIK